MKLSQEKIRDYLLSKPAIAAMILKQDIFRSQLSVTVSRENLIPFCKALKEDLNVLFDFLMDLTTVDYIKEKPRFEMVYQLFSTKFHHRLRIKVRVDEQDLEVPSLTSLWQAANWMERESYDMYGVKFSGHPDLRRILLYEEFEGYPLRKDYPMMKEQPLVPLRDVGEVDQFIDQNVLVRK